MDHYAVIGGDVAKSLSPFFFRQFATQTQQALSYQAISVQPEALAGALRRFRREGFHGLNLTYPLKELGFHLVDACSEGAAQAKAINILTFRGDGSCYGDNSDGLGLLRDLRRRLAYEPKDRSILILGAGGAVRGLLGPLLAEEPALIHIANRNLGRAQTLVADFAQLAPNLAAIPWADLSKTSYDLIINATSASSKGESLSLPPDLAKTPSLCYDLTYAQGETPFLGWGKKQGAIISDGLGMLLEQAALAFQSWRNTPINTENISFSHRSH